MFIWDFVANPVMESILDWFYSQMVGFLGAFFAQMGNMGVELFDLSWVRSVVRFFSQLGLALFAVSVVAVSYTHLDVYKRQPDHGSAAYICCRCGYSGRGFGRTGHL